MACIGVREPAGAPVFLRNDIPRLRRELVAKGSSPAAVGEDLGARGGLLDRGPEFPSLVIARAPAPVRREEDPHAGGARRLENLDHVRHASIRFHHLPHPGPQLSAI
jgi:hypothetical protein